MELAVIHSMRVVLGEDRGKLTLGISPSIRGDSIHVYDFKLTSSQKICRRLPGAQMVSVPAWIEVVPYI